MSRVVLQYVLPLLLPLVFYLVWVRLARVQKGAEAPALTRGPWFWLVIAGFALMVGGLTYTALRGGGSPGGTYQPPHVEGGRIVPGRFE